MFGQVTRHIGKRVNEHKTYEYILSRGLYRVKCSKTEKLMIIH